MAPYSGTQAIAARALFNRHVGKVDDQLSAMVAKIGQLSRELDSAKRRNDARRIKKLNDCIDRLQVNIVLKYSI